MHTKVATHQLAALWLILVALADFTGHQRPARLTGAQVTCSPVSLTWSGGLKRKQSPTRPQKQEPPHLSPLNRARRLSSERPAHSLAASPAAPHAGGRPLVWPKRRQRASELSSPSAWPSLDRALQQQQQQLQQAAKRHSSQAGQQPQASSSNKNLNSSRTLPHRPPLASAVAAAAEAQQPVGVRSPPSGPAGASQYSTPQLANSSTILHLTNSNQTTSTTAHYTTTASSSNGPSSGELFSLNLVKPNYASQQATNGSLVGQQRTSLRPWPGQQREHLDYKTTYACEGSQLDLGCQEGKLIHLMRANYGRLSLSICNEHGHSNLSVQCFALRAFLTLQTMCNKLSNCSVSVSQELFGDPCEGTPKYLEVQYYCDDVGGNHHHQQQQSSAGGGQQQQQAPLGGRQQFSPAADSASATPSHHQSDGGHKSPQSAGPQTNGANVGGSRAAESDDFGALEQGTTTVIQQQQHLAAFDSQYCAPQSSARNLYWNYTRAGQVARQSCPEGSSGKASWLCDSERLRFVPTWSPDFSQCKSTWLQRLAGQLESMLESTASKQTQSAELVRQQSEQVLRHVLGELALLAETQKLFSEDLRRMDIMISQIISQLRSLSVAHFGGLDGWRFQRSSSASFSGGSSPAPLQLFEELFNKLAGIVSSLFAVRQRSAWLDLQPAEHRQRLELRLLNHLKDSGLMLASAQQQLASDSYSSEVQQRPPIRLDNLFAGITVINPAALAQQQQQSSLQAVEPENDESTTGTGNMAQQLKQLQANLNRFVAEPRENQINEFKINEFKIHTAVLRELAANGVTRFLFIGAKKPDYALIRQQMDSAEANANVGPSFDNVNNSNNNGHGNNLLAAMDQQQWSSRVFGVFALAGQGGDILDGQTSLQQQQTSSLGRRLADLLAQWPISVDFSISPDQFPATLANGHPSNVATAASGQTAQQLKSAVLRQCNSFSDINNQQPNRCHTLMSNSTNHICRCDQFGFLTLSGASLPTGQLSPGSSSFLGDFQWNQLFHTNPSQQQPAPENPFDNIAEQVTSSSAQRSLMANSFVGVQNNQAKGQPLGVWTIIFIVFGLTLLVVSLGAFMARAVLRASAQSRLAKKQGFLATGVLGGPGGPVTGSLVDHSLMSGEPMLAAHGNTTSGASSNLNSATTQSTSIIGLNTSQAYHGGAYKPHQQLYAAHLSSSGHVFGDNGGGRWNLAAWLARIRLSRWLPTSFSDSRTKGDHMIQHRVIGSSLANPNSVAYKSQFSQNGYTTNLHHQSTGASSQVPLAAPSSSTSSYVSSSAYYEEIGPGNLTKVNTSQQVANGLASGTQRAHTTIVDPFKRPTAADQQHLLSPNPNHLHHHHHHHHHTLHQHQTLNHQQHQAWPSTTTPALSYSLEPNGNQQTDQQLQMQQHPNGASHLNFESGAAPHLATMLAGSHNKQLHNDLNQLQQTPPLQSSSSSAGSQHSAATSITTANGSTPRHYLFASPTAVNAYKSSMSHQTLHHHLSQQQQQTHYQQQQFKGQEHARFMPG